MRLWCGEEGADDKANLITGFCGDILQARCSLYARAIAKKGAYLNNCVGFFDRTKISMSRPWGPGTNQRANYSGHKRHHCLGYQTVTAPDGLILHIFGLTEGRQPDSVMYARSGTDDFLRDNLVIENKQYFIYGDASYRLRPWLATSYPRRTASSKEIEFNRSMNVVRTCVEWSYAELKQSFTSQDYRRMIKIRKPPVPQLYTCSALLHKFRVCLGYGA